VLPPGPLELNAPAEAGDAFNMRSGTGNGAGGGGGGGSRWGYYAAIVQQQIEAALRTNPKTRNIGAQIRTHFGSTALAASPAYSSRRQPAIRRPTPLSDPIFLSA
jgi:membrane protein involved in colicin uptake